MKEQDLIQALGSLPQDLLDELDEWQKSGAPLTGAEPETDAPARTGKPVITQRRNQTMKQKTEKTPARLRAWTAGIAAAVVLCAAAAVPVGREAVRRAQQSNAGFADSEIAEPIVNEPAGTVIVPDGYTFFYCVEKSPLGGIYDDMPRNTKLEEFCTNSMMMDKAEAAGFWEHGKVTQFNFEGYDIYFIGLPMQEVPDDMRDIGFLGGTLTQSGKLHLNIGALTDAEYSEPYAVTDRQQYKKFDTALLFAVPEGTLPEIAEVSGAYVEYPLADLLTDAPADENERGIWYSQLIEKNLWIDTANGEPGIRLIADEPAEEILTADADLQPDTAQESSAPPLNKLICSVGNDTASPAVPEEGTAKVLRSMSDLQLLIDEADRGIMEMEAAEWFSQFGINEALLETNDVLYFAFKNTKFPGNCYNFAFTGGNIAADGSLTLNFSAFILDDSPVEFIKDDDLISNYYYFYTVPKDSLPDISKMNAEIAETHCGNELPDNVLTAWDESMENPAASEYILKEYLDSTQEYPAWVNSIPEQPCITWDSAE